MRRSILPLLLAFGAAPLAGRVPAQDSAEVHTSGTARRSVRPTLAILTVQFMVEDSTPRRAAGRVALRADSVRRAMMALGVPRDSLVTGSRWYWWAGRISTVPHTRCVPLAPPAQGCVQKWDTTYVAHEAIEVRIPDIDRVGAVLDTALALGISEISAIRFVATDTRQAEQEALREATTQARQQAELIAAASGSRLGPVLSLSTQQAAPRTTSLYELTVSGVAAGASNATEVTAPAVVISQTVYGRWRLLPAP